MSKEGNRNWLDWLYFLIGLVIGQAIVKIIDSLTYGGIWK